MSADDYESLPQSSGMATHMLAGAAAGVLEHCTMYPIDCIKVPYVAPAWSDEYLRPCRRVLDFAIDYQ
jgi:hypothetical protein